MQSQLISEMLLDRREEWQNHTISEMQEKLNSHPAGRYYVADYKTSLVVVYGNSQIGKTSLILNMMGIIPKYQEDVYSVLRANQEYGESSTITAIIYLISPSDSYGMSFSTDENKEIIFFDAEQMIHNLSELRSNFEKGGDEERILYIFIPRKYFCEDVLENDSFSIMDLPGINSRNELEKDHVDSIVSKYMSMATVKMVVTKGDSIQDLSSIEVPEGIDWRAFPNKYFIVVTMAFSQANVKNYFCGDRKESFSEYVLKAYSEIPEIVQSNELEWYPIDIGESYRNLLNSYPEDADEISETQKYFTEKIRKAIIRRKGNGLQNIINDLKSYSKDYYRVNLSILRENIRDLENDISSKKIQLTNVEQNINEYQDIIAGFSTEEIAKFQFLNKSELKVFWGNLFSSIEEFLKSIEISYPMKIKDHELRILNDYLKVVKETIALCNNLKAYIGAEVFEEIYPEGISLDSWEEIKDLLLQQELILTKMFRPDGVSFFFKEVNRTDVIIQLSGMVESWKNIVRNKINSDIAAVNIGITAEKEKYFQYSQLLETAKNTNIRLKFEIEILDKGLREEKINLSKWEIKEKADSNLLADYLHVANREYRKSKTQLKLEMCDKSVGEKLQYLMLLGLIERDYNTILEGE